MSTLKLARTQKQQCKKDVNQTCLRFEMRFDNQLTDNLLTIRYMSPNVEKDLTLKR